MANKRFNKQVGYKDGGKAKSRVRKQLGGGLTRPLGGVGAPVRPLGGVGAPVRPVGFKGGGKAKSRVRKQVGGPMSTARRDMTHGYYQPDMGMQGGRMFRGGGAVKNKGYKHGKRVTKKSKK